MYIHEEDLTTEEYQEKKKTIETVNVNLNESKAGVIISKTNDDYLNFGMFGNGQDIIHLIREIFVRLPKNMRKTAIMYIIEDDLAKSKSLETEAPTNNRLN